MTIHERMIRHREELGLNVIEMAKKIGISPKLLLILEEGGVTLPSIVRKHIQKEYGFTKLESEELVPINMRPHGSDYEPDRYLRPIMPPLNHKIALKEYYWTLNHYKNDTYKL